MSALLIARLTMAFSLGFHIIFAAIGMTIPFFMAFSYFRYLRHKDQAMLALTRMWARGTAILFATGAVSGTVLSFELGLLWPEFMVHAGPIIGMPFSWEGTAFFLEAIALGLFLYGWDRMHPWVHWFCGLMVGVCGFFSGVFVLSANGWMNAPSGFTYIDGRFSDIDPVAAMFNSAWFHQSLHMQLAAFAAVGFAVAGVHAFLLLRGINPKLNTHALRIAMVFGAFGALAVPLSGHLSAQWVAKNQPIKLAAMEAHFHTEAGAPIQIGGIIDQEKGEVSYSLEIPYVLSLLAFDDPNAVVQGLHDFPKEEWPPLNITHIAFQIMVGIGSLLALVSVAFMWLRWKAEGFPDWFLKALILMSPLGFIAIEAGWVVTEVGRQPWVIYGIMKTKDALTQVTGLEVHFLLFLLLYGFLAIACFWLMGRLIKVANSEYKGA